MISGNVSRRVLFAAMLLATGAFALAVPPDVDSIRSVRDISNRAIQNRDLEALQDTWLPNLHVTTSSGQVVSSSGEMSRLFAESFSDPEFITYVRTPLEILLSPGHTYAAERGKWTGRWKSGSGEMSIQGTYLAQWRKVDEGWRIRSELFVALSCDGSEKCRGLP